MNDNDTITNRDQIIKTALPNIPFDGWNWPTIVNAAKLAGLTENDTNRAFPKKMTDVLKAFSDLADRNMLESLASTNPDDLRVRDRIRTATMKRFEILNPHKEAVKASLKFWAIPPRQLCAGKIIWNTADKIWIWAGDTTTDYNHYSKRTLLSGILTPTTLIWLNDKDEQMARTQEFLDHRIDNVLKIGGTFSKIIHKFKGKAA